MAFSYDNANRRGTLTLPNGITASYSYDIDSHLTGISYSLGGNAIGDLTYAYDSLGHRVGMGGSLATMNPPQPVTSATYDAANELASWNGASVSYDADGNLVNDSVHSYSWNARNQLTGIDSGGAATFAYDPFGRRVSKTITGVSATNFFYDGVNPVQELNNTTPSANLMEGGIDEYFTRTDSTGTSNYLADALGSTIALTDANGTTQTQYSYDPFGSTSTSGAASTNSYQFTGREFDVAGSTTIAPGTIAQSQAGSFPRTRWASEVAM